MHKYWNCNKLAHINPLLPRCGKKLALGGSKLVKSPLCFVRLLCLCKSNLKTHLPPWAKRWCKYTGCNLSEEWNPVYLNKPVSIKILLTKCLENGVENSTVKTDNRQNGQHTDVYKIWAPSKRPTLFHACCQRTYPAYMSCYRPHSTSSCFKRWCKYVGCDLSEEWKPVCLNKPSQSKSYPITYELVLVIVFKNLKSI